MKPRTITLQISEDLFAFAQRQAGEKAFFSPEDYLNDLLHMALLDIIEEGEDQRLPPLPAAGGRPVFLDEIEEDEGGGLRLKDDAAADERDDDIPF